MSLTKLVKIWTVVALLLLAGIFLLPDKPRQPKPPEGVSVGGHRFCYPKLYEPNPNPLIGAMIRSVEDRLDSSVGTHWMIVPAKVLKASLPLYVESYATLHNPRVENEASLLIYGMNEVDKKARRHRTIDLWSVMTEKYPPDVEEDTTTNHIRIYEFNSDMGPWELVRTPPPKSPSGVPPQNWRIGWCSENKQAKREQYSCKAFFYYSPSILVEYSINQDNMVLVDDVTQVLKQLMARWESACET